MTTAYPAALDAYNNPTGTDPLSLSGGKTHTQHHTDLNDAVEAIEGTLGVNPQGGSLTVGARLTAAEAATTAAISTAAADATTKANAAQSAAIAAAATDATTKANAAQAAAIAASQPADAELTALAGLVSAADRVPYFTGSGTAALATQTAFARTIIDDPDAASVRATIGAEAAGAAAAAQSAAATDATTKANAAQAASQPLNAELTAFAGLTSAADQLPYFTGADAMALATLTSFARTLLDDANAAAALATLGAETAGASDAFVDFLFFGDGSDGDATLTSGTTTLTRDMFYNNLTVSGTAVFNCAGWKIHVAGVLDIQNAAAGCFTRTANGGGNASGATGGSAGSSSSTKTVGSGGGGTAGTTGTTGAGTQATAATAPSPGQGGDSGTTGAGGSGNGGANAGGAARTATVPGNALQVRRPDPAPMLGGSLPAGGSGGPGGSAGGGDGTNAGGGGGGGAAGGNPLYVFARTILRGASTAAGTFQSKGANAGNGANGVAGNAGGGSAGAGGAGGWVFLVYRFLTGATATNAVDVSGGNAGTPGAGVGTGTAGAASTGGRGGRYTRINLATRVVTETFDNVAGVTTTGRVSMGSL